jgi:hypothetical protein
MKPGVRETSEELIITPAPLPKVTSRFCDYTPPFDVAHVIRRMLASVPSEFLVGLSEVVLTNTAGLSRKVRRSMTKSRKRKVRIIEARGLYHQAWDRRPAWIELYVDNVFRIWEQGFWLRSRVFREQILGEVIFHEIGHHIHYAVKPEHREREDVADVWKVRLQRSYSAKHFPVLGVLLRFAKFISGPLFNRFMKKQFEWQVQKGWMSRAEFEERAKRRKVQN